MRRPFTASLAALVCLAVVPASASAAYRGFRSPSGKLGCAFYDDGHGGKPTVRCDWLGGRRRGLTLTETGQGREITASDTVLDLEARVLAYGKTTSFHALRCTSRSSGITCRSTRSHHGFRVSVEDQDWY